MTRTTTPPIPFVAPMRCHRKPRTSARCPAWSRTACSHSDERSRGRTGVAASCGARVARVLYKGRCQVCGLLIENPDGTRYLAHVHHFQPWNGDNSDRLDNVICVCPNHHAMFELGSLRWHEGTLLGWSAGEWSPHALELDSHLTVELREPKETASSA